MAIAGRVAIVPKGDWEATVNYDKLDLVRYGEKWYLARKPSLNIEPTEGEYWYLAMQNGEDGTDGKDGSDGADGISVKSVVQTTTSTADGGVNVITCTLSDGSKTTFQVKNGSKGTTGATGATGATGSTGQRGSRWNTGTAITGTSTTAKVFSGTGITDALVNDMYLNTSTGYVYKCTVAGNASTAKWAYAGSIKGAAGSLANDNSVDGNLSLWADGDDGSEASLDMVPDNYINIFLCNDEVEENITIADMALYATDGYGDGGNISLGLSSYKWKNIYATNGTIQTSDRNEKNTIAEMTAEQAQALIYGLKPSTYQMNAGTSGRTHWGMISQDIEELFDSLGWSSLDFAGFIKSPKVVVSKVEDENGKKQLVSETIDGEYVYSLRYDEFVAPLIKVVQLQNERIAKLEEKLASLDAQ